MAGRMAMATGSDGLAGEDGDDSRDYPPQAPHTPTPAHHLAPVALTTKPKI